MKKHNLTRAERCQLALRHYQEAADSARCLVDLLADARHWCELHGQSFLHLDRQAFRHYVEESDPDEGGAP